MTQYEIMQGCILKIQKPYFSGSWRKPKFIGDVEMTVEILRHSYGAKKGQHTFTCSVLEAEDNNIRESHEAGDFFLIKGRNLYPIVIEHQQSDESKRLIK